MAPSLGISSLRCLLQGKRSQLLMESATSLMVPKDWVLTYNHHMWTKLLQIVMLSLNSSSSTLNQAKWEVAIAKARVQLESLAEALAAILRQDRVLLLLRATARPQEVLATFNRRAQRESTTKSLDLWFSLRLTVLCLHPARNPTEFLLALPTTIGVLKGVVTQSTELSDIDAIADIRKQPK